jgi:hypothetical protein
VHPVSHFLLDLLELAPHAVSPSMPIALAATPIQGTASSGLMIMLTVNAPAHYGTGSHAAGRSEKSHSVGKDPNDSRTYPNLI